MGVALTKGAIDLGIVTANADAMLAFYRDTLGFEYAGEMKMGGGQVMHRLMCGESMVKIVATARELPSAVPGGIAGGLGYRYFTISISNLAEMMQACEAAGCRIAVKETELRPGVRIGIVEDPDGNWVEFLST